MRAQLECYLNLFVYVLTRRGTAGSGCCSHFRRASSFLRILSSAAFFLRVLLSASARSSSRLISSSLISSSVGSSSLRSDWMGSSSSSFVSSFLGSSLGSLVGSFLGSSFFGSRMDSLLSSSCFVSSFLGCSLFLAALLGLTGFDFSVPRVYPLPGNFCWIFLDPSGSWCFLAA